MSAWIEIEIVWLDGDLVGVVLHVNNGRFGGSTEFYATHDVLKTIAGAFRGFPKSLDDHLELELGTFDPSVAGGGARIELEATSGGAIGRAHLQDGYTRESVYLDLVIAPASIDRFVEDIDALDVNVSARAHLHDTGT